MIRSRILVLLCFAFFLSCIPDKEAPKVLTVYPTSDTLPENLLRFYVQFSHSMKAVDNLNHIKLIDENNQEVKGAIFNNVHELWDAEQKQLTLILDPARVKTGLQANELLGRALNPGHAYRLVVENMVTVDHHKVKPFVKKFMVIRSDTTAPDMNQWDITCPTIGEKDPLQISFPESVDLMSLYHRLIVLNQFGAQIEGKIEIGSKEKQWTFAPLQIWEKGSYVIQVNTRLADPSGNNLNGLFDHKIGGLNYEKEGEIIEIPFKL